MVLVVCVLGGAGCADLVHNEVDAEAPQPAIRQLDRPDDGRPDAMVADATETDAGVHIECTPGETSPCGNHEDPQGVCRQSQKVCRADRTWGWCNTPGFEYAETLCDGLDNDCDGETDEHVRDRKFTPCDSDADTDQCRNGVWRCAPDGRGLVCVDDVPSQEICDGLDNDCDGEVDEDLGEETCGVGACERTVSVCEDGLPQACTPGEPSPETCNNIDDDCDGSVDEHLPPVSCGVGACERQVRTCFMGEELECVPGEPSPETCNGIDDDCDGQTDEEVQLECPLTEGICGWPAVRTECVGGRVECDYGPTHEDVETRHCDGIDNDCDGEVDEGDPCEPHRQEVFIHAGAFVMGSGDSARHVRITRPYVAMAAEFTQRKATTVRPGVNPSRFRGPEHPLESVTWFQAVAYANDWSRFTGFAPCYVNQAGVAYSWNDAQRGSQPHWANGLDCSGWRLPTEAEWERMAHLEAGTDLREVACFRETCAQQLGTRPVGSFVSNGFGLFDTAGNVEEWVWDLYEETSPQGLIVDPTGPPPRADRLRRVIRGGHYNSDARGISPTQRVAALPSDLSPTFGFRLVRTAHEAMP